MNKPIPQGSSANQVGHQWHYFLWDPVVCLSKYTLKFIGLKQFGYWKQLFIRIMFDWIMFGRAKKMVNLIHKYFLYQKKSQYPLFWLAHYCQKCSLGMYGNEAWAVEQHGVKLIQRFLHSFKGRSQSFCIAFASSLKFYAKHCLEYFLFPPCKLAPC